MTIIVCAKQVPDTSGKVAVKPNGVLDRASMQTIANPDDMSALEAALTLKDACGAKVCVLSMGPPAAENMLREMLAMGADEAVLVSAREFGGSDTFATSQILTAAIQEYGMDGDTLILCGRQAIDGDTAQVGPQIAEKLGVAQITYVAEIEREDGGYLCKRMTQNGYMRVRVKTPCLLACMKEIKKPRYMNVEDIMRAYDKPFTVYGYDSLKDNPLIREDAIGLKGSPTNIFKSFTGAQREKKSVAVEASKEGCASLADQLANLSIIRRGV